MGMFDYVCVDPKILPLSKEEIKGLKYKSCCQTKELNNGMDAYHIKDGKFFISRFYAESYDKPYDEIVFYPYQGKLYFYTSKYPHVDLVAEFNQGELVSIKRAEIFLMIRSHVNGEEIDKAIMEWATTLPIAVSLNRVAVNAVEIAIAGCSQGHADYLNKYLKSKDIDAYAFTQVYR